MSGNQRHTIFTSSDGLGLRLVQPCIQNARYTCDIFIIHGLNGGAARTWRHPGNEAIWFRDFLPNDLRDDGNGTNARIWVYGYPADATFSSKVCEMDPQQFAQDLLCRVNVARDGREEVHKTIWVCHSLGGIVVKNALVHAHKNPEYANIWSSTVGIVFMGTPHLGSSLANIGDVVTQIAKACGVSSGTSLLKHLKSDCESLAIIASKFASIASHIKIYSLYETFPQFGDSVVVTIGSATLKTRSKTTSDAILETISETMIPLYSNHRDMGKYNSQDDQNYTITRSCIRKLMRLTDPRRVSIDQPIPRRGSTPNVEIINSSTSEQSSRTSSGRDSESIRRDRTPSTVTTLDTPPMHPPISPNSGISSSPSLSISEENLGDLVLTGEITLVQSTIEAISDPDQILHCRAIALRQSLNIADPEKRYKMFNEFLDEQTADLHGSDLDGNPLAHRIAKRRDCDATYLRALALAGVNLGTADNKPGRRYKPLHIAVLHAQLDKVKFLLDESGVPVNAEDANRRTPLWYAVKELNASENMMKIIEVLLAYNGDKAYKPTNSIRRLEKKLERLYKDHKLKKTRGTDFYSRA